MKKKIVEIKTIDTYNSSLVGTPDLTQGVSIEPIQHLADFSINEEVDLDTRMEMEDVDINLTRVFLEPEPEAKVFLGGTCNGSKWRDKIIPYLEMAYFNPLVDTWTEDAYIEEKYQRKICKYCLYVITPKMKTPYSIAEVIDDSNKKPEGTIFCFLHEDDGEKFDVKYIDVLNKVGKMVHENGGKYFTTLDEVIKYLNGCY